MDRTDHQTHTSVTPDNVTVFFFFNQEVLIVIFLHKNIHVGCGYSLEMPPYGTSNEYQQCMFSWRRKRLCRYPSMYEGHLTS